VIEPVPNDFEVREPRCRVCRNETVRRRVNELLTWRGVPIVLPGGKVRRVTLAEIVRTLEPINEGRSGRAQITYASVWVHMRRHYDLDGGASYWGARMNREFRNALAAKGCRQPIVKVQ